MPWADPEVNRAKARERAKKHYEAHREEKIAYQHEYRRLFKDKIRESAKRYRRGLPMKARRRWYRRAVEARRLDKIARRLTAATQRGILVAGGQDG